MKSCRNFSQQTTRSTPLDPNLMFRCISYYLGAFGKVCCVTTLSLKRAKPVQKFVQRSRIGIFTTNAPNPPHWTLNSCFGVFCTIWMHLGPFGCLTKTQCKTGRTGGKVRATKSRHNFLQRTLRIDPLGPKLMFLCVL